MPALRDPSAPLFGDPSIGTAQVSAPNVRPYHRPPEWRMQHRSAPPRADGRHRKRLAHAGRSGLSALARGSHLCGVMNPQSKGWVQLVIWNVWHDQNA